VKIALIGSAPSSVDLAPYADGSYLIWGCSPAAAPRVKRVDAWFELHGFPHSCITPDYVQWMAKLACPVYVIEPHAEIATSVAYPKQAMLEKYGRYFFTSSLAWMFALALEQPDIEEIGFWGVDMSAADEYLCQRAGCHYFITLARQRGIRVTVPPESDLLAPPALYGFSLATNPMAKKLDVRRTELESRLAQANARYEAAAQEAIFLRGAIDDLTYVQNTWIE
jgi:hypothetical protein